MKFLVPTPSFFAQCCKISSPARTRQLMLVQTCTLNFPRGFVVSTSIADHIAHFEFRQIKPSSKVRDNSSDKNPISSCA